MKLSEYLTKHGISDEKFAEMIGVDRSSVHRMRNEKQRPSFELMQAIAEATGCEVTANDFVGIAA